MLEKGSAVGPPRPVEALLWGYFQAYQLRPAKHGGKQDVWMDLRFCLVFVSLRSSLCYRVLSQCLYLEQNTTKRNSISATLGCL